VEADPGDRVRRFDVTELSQALSVRLGALLGIAATMINWTALWRHSMIGYPTAMLWRNKGRGRLAAGFFCSGRGCSSCPRSGEAPEPNRCGLERTPRVQRPMLHADASGAAQVAPRVHTAKAHMLLRASHRHQGGNQSTTAGSVSLRYDHALDAGLCPPRAL
jgi:hypothetical protein